MSETNSQAGNPQRVLVVGLGARGMSHAQAYQAIDGFELVGLCIVFAADESMRTGQVVKL